MILVARQNLRRTDWKSLNNVVLVISAQKHSGVQKGQRPLVTSDTCCERAPLRARAVFPAGIRTQCWSSGFRAQLWPGAGMVLPCEAAGPALRQTSTRGGQSTHTLSGGGSDKHRGQRLIAAASDHSFAFLTAGFGFALGLSLLQLFLFNGVSIELAPEADSVHK